MCQISEDALIYINFTDYLRFIFFLFFLKDLYNRSRPRTPIILVSQIHDVVKTFYFILNQTTFKLKETTKYEMGKTEEESSGNYKPIRNTNELIMELAFFFPARVCQD